MSIHNMEKLVVLNMLITNFPKYLNNCTDCAFHKFALIALIVLIALFALITLFTLFARVDCAFHNFFPINLPVPGGGRGSSRALKGFSSITFERNTLETSNFA